MFTIKELENTDGIFDGRYKLIRPLNTEGATADVWLALDTNTIDDEYIVDDSIAPYLRGKDTISMWCFSDEYFKRNHLPGFHTGMIISERREALMMLGKCPLTDGQLFDSMVHLAKLLGECLDEPPVVMREYILNHYVGNDAITQFNRENFTIVN